MKGYDLNSTLTRMVTGLVQPFLSVMATAGAKPLLGRRERCKSALLTPDSHAPEAEEPLAKRRKLLAGGSEEDVQAGQMHTAANPPKV